MMRDRELRQLNIPKDWVYKGDIETLSRILGEDNLTGPEARALQGSIMLVFPELEEPDREIFVQAGVRSYLRLLHDNLRHLFYFLVPYQMAGSALGFCAAHSDEDHIIVGEQGINVVYTEHVKSLLKDHLVYAARYASKVGDDWRYVLEQYEDSVDSSILWDVRERSEKELS